MITYQKRFVCKGCGKEFNFDQLVQRKNKGSICSSCPPKWVCPECRSEVLQKTSNIITK